LTIYTIGYCIEVQEVRRYERSIYYRVPRLAKLTCVGALAVPRSESVTPKDYKLRFSNSSGYTIGKIIGKTGCRKRTLYLYVVTATNLGL
jgi:hypothetical protein